MRLSQNEVLYGRDIVTVGANDLGLTGFLSAQVALKKVTSAIKCIL